MNPDAPCGASPHAARWIVRVLGRRLWMVGTLAAGDVVLAGSSVWSAWVLRSLVNAAVEGQQSALLANVILFAAISVGVLVLQSVRRYLQERARSTFENALRQRFLDTVLHADLSRVQATHTGEWMSRLTTDARTVAEGAVSVVPSVAGMAVQLVGSFVLLAAMVPQVAWLLIPGAVVFMAVTLGFRRVLKRLHRRIREADGRVRSFLTECLGSLLVVKSFGREAAVEEISAGLLEGYRAARMRRNHFSNLCNVGFGAAVRAAYLLAVAYCGYGILRGTVSYGTFVGALQLVGQVQGPIANITGCVPRYFAMTASAERLMEAEELPSDGASACADACVVAPERLREFAGIELAGASCRYVPAAPAAEPDAPVRLATEVPEGGRVVVCPDMRIGRGEFVALTGPSGCGKSTSLKLMMALCPLEAGSCSVLLEGGAREPLTAAWRGLFAYVPQGNHLMSGTIREAVTFGDVSAPDCDERVRAALRVACADFVDALPGGLNTRLGEGGCGLSEGQVQRLAIARAVYTDRPVLLLDEVTSSLDPATERQVLQNLRALEDKTVVVVTHRPAALEVCTRQVEFCEG